jgi:hypothetical protein
MTRKLEELFEFPPSGEVSAPLPAETQQQIVKIDAAIDKIDAALPLVKELDTSDKELDELAELAKSSYQDLTDLGMNIDSRYASEIFAVASSMLGHALTAKTAKINKKLKMIDLQLKKLKIDQDRGDNPTVETAHGQVLNRNDLLERLISSRPKD